MTRFTAAKTEVLDVLAREILHNYGTGRVIVAVDGVDGAGKTRFADDLATVVRRTGHQVFRASIDGFHHPRALRYAAGAESPRGYYEDSYDYETFRRVLVDPFRDISAGSFVLEAFDHKRDAQIQPKWMTAKPDAILIIDGIFLHRPELRWLWNFSIWLDAPEEITHERIRARDGKGGVRERYTAGQALYLKSSKPRTHASAIIDNADFDHPRRIFTDSC